MLLCIWFPSESEFLTLNSLSLGVGEGGIEKAYQGCVGFGLVLPVRSEMPWVRNSESTASLSCFLDIENFSEINLKRRPSKCR